MPGDGQRRQDDRGETHAQRLAHLADAHGQAAFLRAEPSEDQPAARRVDRRARGTDREEQEPALQGIVDGGGPQPRRAGDRQPEGEDAALAESVRRGAPRDERAQDPGDRRGDQEGRRLEAVSLGAQRRDQEGEPVLRRAPGRESQQAHREHDPASRILLLGHRDIVC